MTEQKSNQNFCKFQVFCRAVNFNLVALMVLQFVRKHAEFLWICGKPDNSDPNMRSPERVRDAIRQLIDGLRYLNMFLLEKGNKSQSQHPEQTERSFAKAKDFYELLKEYLTGFQQNPR